MRTCVLVSGGADSAVLLDHYRKRGDTVFPVYVRQGLRWEKAELYWLQKYLRAVRNSRLKPLTVLEAANPTKNHWSRNGKRVPGLKSPDQAVYLPGRNILLCSQAAVWCAERKIGTIAMGSLRGNPFPDATQRFFKTLSQALSLGLGRKIAIRAPFLHRRKKEILKSTQHLPLRLTFSCLAPRGTRPCGRCNKCAERTKVF